MFILWYQFLGMIMKIDNNIYNSFDNVPLILYVLSYLSKIIKVHLSSLSYRIEVSKSQTEIEVISAMHLT